MGVSVKICILFVPIIMAILNPVSASCSKTLIFANSDWLPSISGKEEFQQHRLDLDLLSHIMKIAGCNLIHRPMPTKRLLKELEHGYADGNVGASYTEERAKYAYFSIPYRKETIVMFMRREDVHNYQPRFVANLGLSDHTFGVDYGVWYGAAFDRVLKTRPEIHRKILTAEIHDIKFDWLVRKRVDIAIDELHFGLHALKRNGLLDKIAVHPLIINEDDVHFMFSKKSVTEEDVAIVNKAIALAIGTPEYNKILEFHTRRD